VNSTSFRIQSATKELKEQMQAQAENWLHYTVMVDWNLVTI